MATGAHELAPHHMPFFITAPGETDVLFVGTVAFALSVVLLVGVAYFALHALPEKLAHRANHSQLQLIGILALIALFTHNNWFWIAALLIAAVRFPDFLSPLKSIAQSMEEQRHRQG